MAVTGGSFVVLVGLVFAATCPGAFSNTVTLAVNSAIVYEGGLVDYLAFSPVSTTITEIIWTINGIPLSELPGINHDPIVANTRFVSLIIRNASANLNDKIVSCTALLSTGMNITCSPPQTIRVQGILGSVVNLSSQYNVMDNTVNISWVPPSAIVVPPAMRPEIFYCVEISNSTGTESIGCNTTVDMNENTSIMLRDVECGIDYDITVTPFNRLGDGAARMMAFPDAPVISDLDTVPQLNGSSFTYTYVVSGLVCSCNAVVLDASTVGNLQCNLNTPGFITVNTENVLPNRKFSLRLFANNSRTFRAIQDLISTFDSDLTISSVTSTVEYSLAFVGGSAARGIFIALLFVVGQSVDFSRSLYFTQERSRAEMTNQLMGLSAGTYKVLAYDVESSGEITSENAADQLSVTVTGSSTSTTPLQTLSGITCNSTEDGITVNVICDFNTTLYNGYRVYIQDTSDVMLRFVESTVSGENVSINGSLVGGEHLVMVHPIWNSDIPNGRLAPALRVMYNLDTSITTLLSISEASTVLPTDSSSTSSPDPTTSSPPPVVGPSSPAQTMATIIGVSVAFIVVIIIAAVLIVFIVIILVRWKKRKMVSVEIGETLVMFEQDGQRSPSADKEIPAYASARPPPKKSTSEPVKANGNDAPPPPSEGAPTQSNAAALYSTVDLNKKKKERKAKNGDNEKDEKVEFIPPPEPTNEYASVDSIQKNKKEEAEKQAHQEPQYETVQLKHQKPTQDKVEDEHLVQYSTIDYYKKAEPEPKKETPKQESVEKPHVGDKIYVRREDVYQVLGDIATRWKEFALLVGASEDYVDEIDCNNTSDFGCLDHFLVMTVKHRSREEMSVALVKMGLMDKAQTILQLPSAQ